MKRAPLVSVMMICHNSADTLLRALVSLVLQTHEIWECVLVDDGSTDDPLKIVKQIQDPRIRAIRLDTNQGRGYARQVALNECRGEYLAFLDADDWCLPDKLRRQMEYLEKNPIFGLIADSIFVESRSGELLGVLRSGFNEQSINSFPPLRGLGPLKVYCAPSMVRMNEARKIRYAPDLLRSEDFDFFLKLLKNIRYVTTGEAGYVWRWQVSKVRIEEGLFFKEKVFKAHKTSCPREYVRQILRLWFRRMFYGLIFFLKQERIATHLRMSKPSAKELQNYNDQSRHLSQKIEELFR